MSDHLALHHDAFVADLHCDAIHPISRGYGFGDRHDTYHVDLPRLREGGVGLQVFAAYANPWDPVSPKAFVDRSLKRLKSEFRDHSDRIELCRSPDEALRIRRDGRIAAVLAIEGAGVMENSLEVLRQYHDLGVRIVTLVHNESTDWCLSCFDKEPSFDGLTDFGREMVAAMNRLGVIVDLSHSADSSIEQAVAVSSKPVIASHSNARGLVDHPRNLPDHLARAVAKSGGMIGITFVNQFLKPGLSQIEMDYLDQHPGLMDQLSRLFVSEMPEAELQKEWAKLADVLEPLDKLMSPHRATLGDVVDHIDYFVKLVGIDHVGIGSDFDGISGTPEGLEDCSRWPNLTAELIRRQYSEADVMKILGGNFLRVFEEVCGL